MNERVAIATRLKNFREKFPSPHERRPEGRQATDGLP